MNKLFLIILSLLSLLASCDDFREEDFLNRTREPCNETAYCPYDTRCVYNVCAGELYPLDEFSLRFIPPTGSSQTASDLQGTFMLDDSVSNLNYPYRLANQVNRTGMIKTKDGHPVTGRVIATPVKGITSKPLTYTSELLTKPPVNDSNASNSQNKADTPAQEKDMPMIAISLPTRWTTSDGGTMIPTYKLHVVPTDPPLPPYDFESWRPNDYADPFEIILPAIGDSPKYPLLLAYFGRVYQDVQTKEPIAGLKVMAIDDNGLQVSTLTTTDENGHFMIRFWLDHIRPWIDDPDRKPLRIKISGQKEEGIPLPTITRPIDMKQIGSIDDQGNESKLQTFYLSSFDSPIQVQGFVQDTNHIYLANTDLVFFRNMESAFHEVKTTTDANGYFSVQLYPGEYSVQIIPPITPNLNASINRQRFTVTPNMRMLTFTANLLKNTYGIVADQNGDPISNVRVVSELKTPYYVLTSGAIEGETTPSRIVETFSDETGGFWLDLDQGVHMLSFYPVTSQGLPSAQQEIQIMPDGFFNSIVKYYLPSAAVLHFNLQDFSDTPLNQVTVEIWSRVNSYDFQPVTPEWHKVTSGISNAQGEVSLALPSLPMRSEAIDPWASQSEPWDAQLDASY